MSSVKRIFYPIDEAAAKAASDANSMSDYVEGSATQIYKNHVNHAYNLVEQIKEKKPDLLEKAEITAQKYSRKLADYYNKYYQNEASCPNVMISGPANFPVKKKEKQNERRYALSEERKALDGYVEKIQSWLYKEQPILSDDESALEKLTAKLDLLEQRQADMKAVNAYYRKEKTLDGCPELTSKDRMNIAKNWANGWYPGVPFPPYVLRNNRQEIERIKERIEALTATKEKGTTEKKYDGFTVRENTENMRLQFLFDEKPGPEIRELMKKKGFRWSQSESAWQRKLTDNARYAGKQIVEELQPLSKYSAITPSDLFE